MITALVIDDNPGTADSLCQLLSLLDIEAQPSYGPRAALEYLLRNTPNLVLLDLNMPGVQGMEVLGYLRREPRLVDVPVIVVTAEEEHLVLQRALKNGATAVIIKPASIEELTAVLRKAKVIK
jgi:CheY-like chemotaxis protein